MEKLSKIDSLRNVVSMSMDEYSSPEDMQTMNELANSKLAIDFLRDTLNSSTEQKVSREFVLKGINEISIPFE